MFTLKFARSTVLLLTLIILAVAPRARVAVPVSTGVNAVPMLLAVAPRARVTVPVRTGANALPMRHAVAPRARVGVATGPGARVYSPPCP